jgi:hypothetical protein
MQRPSLYNEIHKGLRSTLFSLLVDTGNTSSRDEAGLAALHDRFKALRSMLDEHAGHEDKWVEPLIAKARPELAAEISSAHTEIDAMLDGVEAAYDRLTNVGEDGRDAAVSAAYLTLAGFVGAYISHMSLEEDVVMPALWEVLSDEEILNVSAQLRGSIPPPRMAEYLSVMLPAMNLQERTAMLSGMKQAAPPEAFQGVVGLAEQVLAADDFAALRENVGL